MSEVIIKLCTSAVMPVAGFFVVKNLLNSRENLSVLKTLFILFLLSLFNFAVYNIEYQAMITILNFCVIMIGYKFIFKINFFDSFLLSIIIMLFTAVSEIILCILILPFSEETLRDFRSSLVLGNLLVAFISIILSKIKYFNSLVNKLLLKLERNGKFKTIVVACLWILIISIFCYMIFKSSVNTIDFWLSIFIMSVFILFMLNYFRDKNKYILLNEKFDSLYDYIQTIEEHLDNEQLNIHEYKNQLSVIRSMSSNKKIHNYIDSLVENNDISDEWSNQLKNLPKGGLKGLLYYKLAQAESKGLNLVIDISDKCYDYLENLSLETVKELSRLIGIYMDNSIEASINTKKKYISLEIYVVNKEVNIVISNSIESMIDLSNVNRKGYTSKGNGRGRGLYLASKIIDKNGSFKSDTTIINDYFIQKLTIVNEK